MPAELATRQRPSIYAKSVRHVSISESTPTGAQPFFPYVTAKWQAKWSPADTHVTGGFPTRSGPALAHVRRRQPTATRRPVDQIYAVMAAAPSPG
ncbi:hypothetical protein GCM10020358_59560 [Amorphoplanes nipponensis]|uniref:Uncharacterized protein n=1 Tax=Actinoplanes nipponensis TaxID=135950 RepID=A0A919J9L6_9ACTN|nr:hypothetical protein Ani05nite_04680 [Actinoplanes nipponensis]